tara:strand:+ start:44 stop:667 length:624 start_codon:yes stop_codon:yes gene_type:complete
MLNTKAIKEEQKKLAKKLIIKTDLNKIKTIAGVDIFQNEKNIICSIVILNYETLEIIEAQSNHSIPTMPYLEEISSFRVASCVVETLNKIQNKPDILMIDGEGILNKNKLGIASHVSLLLNIPSIGISKKTIGRVEKDKVFIDDEVRGYLLRSKEKANPIYTSPGHLIGFKLTKEITEKMLKGNKMPLPLHEAHKSLIKIKKNLTST